MDLDIINRIVAKRLGVPLNTVEYITTSYWKNIKDHIYNYDPQPININGVGVLYNHKWYVKNEIKRTIKYIRNLKKSKRYKENSIVKEKILREVAHHLQKSIQIRKHHKYTN